MEKNRSLSEHYKIIYKKSFSKAGLSAGMTTNKLSIKINQTILFIHISSAV